MTGGDYPSDVSEAKRKKPAKAGKKPAKRAPAKRAPAKAKATTTSSKADVVKDLIGKVEKKLVDGKDVKATVGDYIRLVQLHKELQDEEPQDIEVRWIDPEKKEEDPNEGT